jgi:rhodanese-related sulfurtransferase
MPQDLQQAGVQRLQAEGAAIVEVLPRAEYEREHIAGALSLPLSELTRASADRVLGGDKTRPLAVYCQDVE